MRAYVDAAPGRVAAVLRTLWLSNLFDLDLALGLNKVAQAGAVREGVLMWSGRRRQDVEGLDRHVEDVWSMPARSGETSASIPASAKMMSGE